MDDERYYEEKRRQMVMEQLVTRNIIDLHLLYAMMQVERHLFVPKEMREFAYEDSAIAIGEGQTLSQPYLLALIGEMAYISRPHAKLLEIGSGSGYAAAVFSKCVEHVFGIEILPSLYKRSRETLQKLGYKNISLRLGDGCYGWAEKAPFDIIIISTAVPFIPKRLKEQLADGGTIVAPIGSDSFQELTIVRKIGDTFEEYSTFIIRLMPMIGEILHHKGTKHLSSWNF